MMMRGRGLRLKGPNGVGTSRVKNSGRVKHQQQQKKKDDNASDDLLSPASSSELEEQNVRTTTTSMMMSMMTPEVAAAASTLCNGHIHQHQHHSDTKGAQRKSMDAHDDGDSDEKEEHSQYDDDDDSYDDDDHDKADDESTISTVLTIPEDRSDWENSGHSDMEEDNENDDGKHHFVLVGDLAAVSASTKKNEKVTTQHPKQQQITVDITEKKKTLELMDVKKKRRNRKNVSSAAMTAQSTVAGAAVEKEKEDAAAAATEAVVISPIPSSVLRKWKELQADFRFRDRMFRRISKSGKSKAFVNLLKQHEEDARAILEEQLIVSFLSKKQQQQQQKMNSKAKSKSAQQQEDCNQRSVDPMEIRHFKEKLIELSGRRSKSSAKQLSASQTSVTNRFLSSSSSSGTPDCDDSVKQPSRSSLAPSWMYQLYKTVLFECNTALPATVSLVVHTLCHNGIFDFIGELLSEIQKRFLKNDTNNNSPILSLDAVYLILFVIGIVCVRLSGYLYWWSNDVDYDIIKFDFHNRRILLKHDDRTANSSNNNNISTNDKKSEDQGQQQQPHQDQNPSRHHRGLLFWDVRCLLWVKRHDCIRCALYVLGYTIAYISTGHLYFRIWRLFDQREYLLKDLPSKNYDLNVCLSDIVSPESSSEVAFGQQYQYSFACEAEIARREEAYELLQEADYEYTSKILSADSFALYWQEQGEGVDEDATQFVPLASANTGMVFCATTVVVCIAILQCYGFVFWYKY